jgi:integrase
MSHVKDLRAQGRNWVAVITGEHGKHDHSRSFRTEREALAYITTQEATKLTGRFVSPREGAITLAQWWALQRQRQVDLNLLAPSSAARNDSYWKNQIGPHLGDHALRDIDSDMVQGWVDGLCCVPYAPETVKKAHGLVSQVLKAAVKARRIPFNPCEDTTLPAVTIEEQMFLDLDQVDALVGAIDPRYALAVETAAVTGLRAMELFGLRVKDVKSTGWLHVRWGLVDVRGELYHRPKLKTDAARRKVPVPDVILADLQAHIENRRPDDLVFTAPEGGPVRLSAWRKRVWYRATCAVHLGELVPCTFFDDPDEGSCVRCTRAPKRPQGPHYVGLRLHDLRHTAASLWIEEGRELFHIAKYLGHESLKMIEQRYGHLRDERHDAANEALNRRLKSRRAQREGTNITDIARRRRAG